MPLIQSVCIERNRSVAQFHVICFFFCTSFDQSVWMVIKCWAMTFTYIFQRKCVILNGTKWLLSRFHFENVERIEKVCCGKTEACLIIGCDMWAPEFKKLNGIVAVIWTSSSFIIYTLKIEWESGFSSGMKWISGMCQSRFAFPLSHFL